MNFFQRSNAQNISLFHGTPSNVALKGDALNSLATWFTYYNAGRVSTQQITPENFNFRFTLKGEPLLEINSEEWKNRTLISYTTATQTIKMTEVIQIKLEHKQGNNASEEKKTGGKRWAGIAYERILYQILFPEESPEFKEEAKRAAVTSLFNLVNLIRGNSHSIVEGKSYKNPMLSSLTNSLLHVHKNFIDAYAVLPANPVLYHERREAALLPNSANGDCGHAETASASSEPPKDSDVRTYPEGENSLENISTGDIGGSPSEEDKSYHTTFGQSLL